MRIKMITLECGPGGNFAPGDERTVGDEKGRQLVAGRYAIDITPRLVETADIVPPEAAVVAPFETAVGAPAETRKGGRKR
jgi:hypothetical protein